MMTGSMKSNKAGKEVGTLEFDFKQVVRTFSQRKYLFKDLESGRESAMERSWGRAWKAERTVQYKGCEGQLAQGV